MKSQGRYRTFVRRHAGLFVALSLSCTSAIGIGCGLNLYSIDQDAQMGKQMDQQIRSTPQQYPILNNETIRSYVQNIVNQIKMSPKIKYRNVFPYQVTIINDDKTLNAFCTPGGYIYVYTGLMKYIDNEGSLAGILAHEMGHAEERHGTKHMTTQLGAEVALSIALGNNPTRLAQIVGNSAVMLGMLKNSRDDETQADEDSFQFMRSTSYWPGSVKLFFEKMMREGKTGSTAAWLSTHPADQTRVDHINQLLRDNNIPGPTSANLFPDRYKQMMTNLR